ncbi:MAG: lysophospholipase [Candidatus Obscuribacterales bacterium]|nr:lysophospholipase [Candidatus Obscuribacterales bacterium]
MSQTIAKRAFLSALAMVFSIQLAAIAEPVRQDYASIGKDLNVPIYFWNDEKVATKKGVIVAIHGVTLYAKRFDVLAKRLAEQGYLVYAADLRGFGSWRTETSKFGGDSKIHYNQSESDLLDVLKALKSKYSNYPVYALGESLGANMAVWVASTEPQLVNGIILASPCVKRRARYNGAVLKTFAKGIFHPYKELSLEPHIKPFLSDDQRVTDEYMKDPNIYRDLSPADLIKSVKTNKLTIQKPKKIPAGMPILIIAGRNDQIYRSTAIMAFVKKIPAQDKSVFILEDKGHLLLEHAFLDPKVLQPLDDWLQKREQRILTSESKI